MKYSCPFRIPIAIIISPNFSFSKRVNNLISPFHKGGLRGILYIIFLLPVLVSLPLSAGELTIDECRAKVMSNNPEILKAGENLKIAEAKRFQAFSSFFPNISAGALYTHLDQEPPTIDFSFLTKPGVAAPQIAGNPLLQYAFQDNYSANIKLNQPIFYGGKNFRSFRAADARYQAANAELKIIREGLNVEVIRAYYGVIVARAMRDLSIEASEKLKHHLEMVQNFTKSGIATEYDFLKAEVQYLSWSPKVAKAERELSGAVRRLKLLMNIAPAGELGTMEKSTIGFEPYEDGINLDKAKELALSNRPEITLVKEMKKQALELGGVKLSSLFPQFSFQYNYNLLNQRNNFNLDRDSWKGWWDLRLMLNWEIFNFGKTFSEVRENSYKAGQLDIELKSVIDKIISEVEDIFEYRNETKISVEAWKKSVELAGRGYEIASEKYKNGSITNLEVLDSHVALIDAKVQYLKALYDYKIANAEFQRIVPFTN